MATSTTSAFTRRVEGMLAGGYKTRVDVWWCQRWSAVVCRCWIWVNAGPTMIMNDDKSIVPERIRNNRFD